MLLNRVIETLDEKSLFAMANWISTLNLQTYGMGVEPFIGWEDV